MAGTERLVLGPLSYQAWCYNATCDDVDELVKCLNTVQGVTRATRQEDCNGYYVAVQISESYPTQVVLSAVKRDMIAWAKKRDVPYGYE